MVNRKAHKLFCAIQISELVYSITSIILFLCYSGVCMKPRIAYKLKQGVVTSVPSVDTLASRIKMFDCKNNISIT